LRPTIMMFFAWCDGKAAFHVLARGGGRRPGAAEPGAPRRRRRQGGGGKGRGGGGAGRALGTLLAFFIRLPRL
jgi:hypothetical protein